MSNLARNSDPGGSHEGARGSKKRMMVRVLIFLRDNDRPPGWSDYEIEMKMGGIGGAAGYSPWHRTGREEGYAAWVTNEDGDQLLFYGRGRANVAVGATRITDKGRAFLGALSRMEKE